MALSSELLDVIACPKCKGDLELTIQQDWFICHACHLKYPIQDEIPMMLIEEAVASFEEAIVSSEEVIVPS